MADNLDTNEEKNDMLALSTTPLKRVLWASLSCVFIYLASVWHAGGPAEELAIATAFGVLALQLLRQAAPSLRLSNKTPMHPVQSRMSIWRICSLNKLASQAHS